MKADRRANKKPAPVRNAGEWVVEQVVGKKNQGGKRLIYWSKQDGEACEKSDCTWEGNDAFAELDPEFLTGHDASFRLGQTTFKGVIQHQASDGEETRYWVKFQSRRHQDKYVDLDLPNTVSSGEYSWWVLDGYSERVEQDED